MTEVALVTGGASGIGRGIVERLEDDGYHVVVVDVAEDASLDVGEASTWERVAAGLDRLDVACLNAGVVTGTEVIDELTDEAYRRILRVNVDGVVFGVRALVPVLERSGGGDVVVTASLAGLTSMAQDPIYAATKHFLVGFVRSVAPQLEERGIRINAVCPGIVDTPLLGDAGRRLEDAGFPLLSPQAVAAAVAAALESGTTGQAWVCQPGREPEPYRFGGVPGPRAAGAQGVRPPW
jgi:NAD(P)-dependent dehydrogenase (short-subunit alcohol dehydrogenase family)